MTVKMYHGNTIDDVIHIVSWYESLSMNTDEGRMINTSKSYFLLTLKNGETKKVEKRFVEEISI